MKRQRNEIFETLKARGIDPQDCTLTLSGDNHVNTMVTQGRIERVMEAVRLEMARSNPPAEAVIRHKPTGSEFKIFDDRGGVTAPP